MLYVHIFLAAGRKPPRRDPILVAAEVEVLALVAAVLRMPFFVMLVIVAAISTFKSCMYYCRVLL